MKKITFLLVTGCLLLAGGLKAQITVTQADMPTAGGAVRNQTDTMPTVTPGSTGTGQVWNFYSLKRNTLAIDSFATPSATPYGTYFPTANVADTVYGTAGYIYLKSSASAFSGVGTVQNFMGYNAIIPVSPDFVQIALPATVGTTDGGVSNGDTKLAITYLLFDSARVKVQITYADTIDASGTLTTPFTPSYSVLRQKHYEVDIDSLYVHTKGGGWTFYQAQVTKNHQYKWYTNGIGDVLVQMQMDTSNTKVTRVQWYDGIPNGINELSQTNNTWVYPNPCSNQITFKYSMHIAQAISVFDITGRKIETTEMKNGAAIINTSLFTNGIYLYRVLDKTGNILSNGKFTVQQ